MALTNKTGRKHEHLWAWRSKSKEWFCERCNEILVCNHDFQKEIEIIVWYKCTKCPGNYHESEAL